MAEKEYIERGAAKEPFGAETILARSIRKILDEVPAADVVEVKHGRWLHQRLCGHDVVDCSECKTLGSPQWKWCPICGAMMDGE